MTFHSPTLRPVPAFLAAGERTREPHEPAPAPWSDILDKADDRLIRDIGLTREDILGPEEAFWREWAPHRRLWDL